MERAGTGRLSRRPGLGMRRGVGPRDKQQFEQTPGEECLADWQGARPAGDPRSRRPTSRPLVAVVNEWPLWAAVVGFVDTAAADSHHCSHNHPTDRAGARAGLARAVVRTPGRSLAKDHRNPALSITETPQVTSGVGGLI